MGIMDAGEKRERELERELPTAERCAQKKNLACMTENDRPWTVHLHCSPYYTI